MKTANEILLEKRQEITEAVGIVQFTNRFVSDAKKVLSGKLDPKFASLEDALKKAVAELNKAIDEVL